MSPSDPKAARPRTGAHHLARQSVLRKRIQDEQIKPVVLIVEDERLDAHFVETPLRRLFGISAKIDIATSVAGLVEKLKMAKYNVILLDDRIDQNTTADQSIPLIRQHQPKVPIVVFSRLLTRKRRAELQRLHCHSIHGKEDLDSAVLGEAILTALGHAV